MPPSKSCKIDVTPKAHKVAKLYSTIKGRNIKDSVSSLIIQILGSEIIKINKENPDTISGMDIEINELIEDDLDHDISLIDSPNCDKFKDDLKISPTSIVINARPFIQIPRAMGEPINASSTAYQIYGFLSSDPSKAQTPEEIVKILPGISISATQRALQWLLEKGAIKRNLRENINDRRKNSWEYWKLIPSNVLKKKGIPIDTLLRNLPSREDQAISIRELVIRLEVPESTIRDSLKNLERNDRVISIIGTNHKHQATLKYYLPDQNKANLHHNSSLHVSI